HDLVFTGVGTVFEGSKGVRKDDVAKQTILLVHLRNGNSYGPDADLNVYWTKPADLAYAPGKPLPKLFAEYGDGIRVLLADGTVKALKKETDEATLRAMIERQGGKK